MENPGERLDTENLLSLGDDLIGVLSNKKDLDSFRQAVEGAKALRSSCEDDARDIHNLLEDNQKKINAYKEKIDNAMSETTVDSEIEHLESTLEEKMQMEDLLYRELRVINEELDGLESQRISFEARKAVVRKEEEDVLKAENLLSLCASVTNIIPNLDDGTRISGFILDRNMKKAEKFELDAALSPLEACNRLWRTL